MSTIDWKERLEVELETYTEMIQEKLISLSMECEAAILAGFTSQTTNNFYKFNYQDQANFNQQTTMILLDPEIQKIEWKTENKGRVIHTRSDFISICKEAEAHKRRKIERYWDLQDQVLAAQSQAEIDSVTW